MSDKLPTTILNQFRLPVHPAGVTTRPINMLYHKQGKFFVGWGPGATEEPIGLEYEIGGSGFGWRRIAKGEKPRYIMDDPLKPTPQRDELGDRDQALWPIGSDGPLDPWRRVAQLDLVRVQDGTRLIFETPADSAFREVEDLVTEIRWQARNKGPLARPVIITGTKQVRNAKKNQTWWIPTFAITDWNEPEGTVLPLAPEPRQGPGLEEPAPAVKPSGEALLAVRGVPLAAPRERKHRNAYAGKRAKQTGKPRTALEDDLDDKIVY